MHTRMTDILIKTGRYSLRIAVVRVTPSGEADSHRCCALFNPAHRDDEHALILQYCQTLGGEGSPCSQPQSPAQILQAVEREERGELERVIARLEEEQRYSRVSQVFFCSRIYIYLFFFFLFSSTLVMGNIWCVTQYDIHPFWWTYIASHAPRWQRASLPGCRFQPSEESRSFPFVYSPQISLR